MSVVDFISEHRVNDAWDAYSALASKLSGNPKLLCDRSFNEEMAQKHECWRRLYLRSLRTLETA